MIFSSSIFLRPTRPAAAALIRKFSSSSSFSHLFNRFSSHLGSSSSADREIRWLLENFSSSKISPGASRARAEKFFKEENSPVAIKLRNAIEARISGTPLQYLLGDVSFCGQDFLVRPPVLIPRTETEILTIWTIENIKREFQRKTENNDQKQEERWSSGLEAPGAFSSSFSPILSVLDVCSGSGCISLSLASAFPNGRVVGIDILPQAIELANENLARVEKSRGAPLKCSFAQQDLYSLSSSPSFAQDFLQRFDLLISNPPYITTAEYCTLPTEVRDHESPVALLGGSDGLAPYREIIRLAGLVLVPLERRKSNSPEIILEFGSTTQGKTLTGWLREGGFSRVELFKDFSGRDRWIAGARE